jgi:peroxiredoxin
MKKNFTSLIVTLCCLIVPVSAEFKLLPPGSDAPTFSLPTLSGERLSLRVYCGDTLLKPHINNVRQTVILSFWATYCAPCLKEMPELIRFIQQHQNDSVKVFCISIDKEGTAVVAPFVADKGYTIPVLLDPYRKTAERYGVSSLPALFVIDPNGKIRFSSIGYNEKDPLDLKLDKILADIKTGKTMQYSINAGDAVAVQTDSVPVSVPKYNARARWEAIMKVEGGTPVSDVAQSLKITVEELSSWRADLKKAAITLWGE